MGKRQLKIPQSTEGQDEHLNIEALMDIIATNAEVIKAMTGERYGAIPEADFRIRLGIPESSMNQLKREGLGPETFKIGKRNFIHEQKAREWIDRMAGVAEVAEEALQEAYAEGRKEGFTEGHKEGFSEGHKEGFGEGLRESV